MVRARETDDGEMRYHKNSTKEDFLKAIQEVASDDNCYDMVGIFFFKEDDDEDSEATRTEILTPARLFTAEDAVDFASTLSQILFIKSGIEQTLQDAGENEIVNEVWQTFGSVVAEVGKCIISDCAKRVPKGDAFKAFCKGVNGSASGLDFDSASEKCTHAEKTSQPKQKKKYTEAESGMGLENYLNMWDEMLDEDNDDDAK